MTHLLTFDTGKSSGVTLGHYNATTPYTRLGAWQVTGGLQGLLDWVRSESLENDSAMNIYDVAVCEKFVPISGKGFSQTLDSTLPLVIEGALIALDIMPDYQPENLEYWQRANAMYFMGGSTKAEKLKRSRAWLKEHGLLLTGKDVGQKDADDAISSTLHAFAYLIRQRHRPTMERYKIGVQE